MPHFRSEDIEKNRLVIWQNTGKSDQKTMSFKFTALCMSWYQGDNPVSEEQAQKLRDYYLRTTDSIQTTSPLIQDLARALANPRASDEEKVMAFYRYCAYDIGNTFVTGSHTAVECLTNRYSDCGGKSRLMVALCRASAVPARLVGGLIMNEARKQQSHVWVEVLQNKQWVPYCPLNRLAKKKPSDYLILYRGDYALIRHKYVDMQNYGFTITAIQADSAGPQPPLQRIFARLSFNTLPPEKQWAIRIMLLIPLGALIVCIMRNIIGIPTIGTFAPVLIALGIYMVPLKWGILLLFTFILLGMLVRWWVDALKLLLVPRLSVMLTIVISGLMIMTMFTDSIETHFGAFTGLLPVVILTMAIERCWMLELEDGFVNMFKHLIGTLIVLSCIYFTFRWRELINLLYIMPELLLFLIGIMLLIGRYAGFRLSELFRFKSLSQDNECDKGL